jgi:hypothetical protein
MTPGLNLNELQGPAGLITVSPGSSFLSSGSPLQVIYCRTDLRNVYSASISGDGTTITELGLTITPKSANSLLVMRWMINGEVSYNSTFVIHKNQSIITTTGYEGYNRVDGNVRYSGILTPLYDNNDDSTLFNHYIQYVIPAGSTGTVTYAPAIRASASTAYSLYLNRIVNAANSAAYESAISTGVLMEIAQ